MITLTLLEDISSYVPALIVRRAAADPDGAVEPATARFPAAVLFADISGFTALTEQIVRRGPSGAEELTWILNTYFGHLIDTVTAHGGDVVKFAGDGLLAVWPLDGEDLRRATLRAAQCALAVQAMMAPGGWLETEPGLNLSQPLQVKIGIGAGEVTTMHLGGIYGRWEMLVTGDPLVQMGLALNQAQPADVILARAAWSLVQEDCTGASITSIAVQDQDSGALPAFTRLQAIHSPLPLRPLVPPLLPPQRETLVRSYVPKAILSRLNAGQTRWLAELRRVTVLFVNLPDLSDSIPLERAQAAMQALQTALYRYQGSVSRLGTDEKGPTLVAALGLPPLAHEDDAARGVLAALAMHSALDEMGLRCAIGVTTGPAFCGAVGSERRREYTMMGTSINLSARLMQIAASQLLNEHQPMGYRRAPAILCDETTYQAARTRMEFSTLSPLVVKGKRDPVTVYRPLLRGTEPPLPVHQPRARAETVGRAAERMRLSGLLHKLMRRGTGSVVVIEGDTGMGKSRLVEDLRLQAESLGLAVLSGAGSAVEQSTPYLPWRSVFSQLLGILPWATKAEQPPPAAATLAPALSLLNADAELQRLAPLLRDVLPLDLPDNEITSQMSGQARAKNTRHLCIHLLQTYLAPRVEQHNGHHTTQYTRPLLLLIEDAQWLDSASWSFALDLAQHINPERGRGLPMMLLIATRPLEDVPPDAYHALLHTHGTQVLHLEGMPSADIRTVIAQRLGCDTVPPPVLRAIHEKAQGNPFFSEELALALRDNGLISISGGSCRLTADEDELDALRLPDTVQSVITSRIDQLAPSQQMTLKVASVIGETFSLRTLRDIHPVETERPYQTSYLATLQLAGLTVLLTSDPEPIYAFKHTIIRDVTYNLMIFAQRRQLHGAVATWYERYHADDLSPFYSLLAYHWGKAEQAAQAAAYLDKAGDQALRRGAYQEAVTFFAEAIELDERQTANGTPLLSETRPAALQRVRWERQLGEAYYGLGQLAQSRAHLERAVALLGRPVPTASTRLTASVLRQLFFQGLRHLAPFRLGEYALEARARALGKLARGPRTDARAQTLLEAARAYEMLTPLYYYDSQMLPTVYTALRSVNLAERAAPSPELAHAYGAMQVISGVFRLPALTRIYARKAEAVARQSGQIAALGQVYQARGMHCLGRADWAGARGALRKAVVLADQLRDQRRWTENQALLGLVALHQGMFDEASRVCKEITATARRYGDAQAQTWGLLGQAECLLPSGQSGQAMSLLGEAERLMAENLDQARAEEIWAYAVLALTSLREGNEQLARHAGAVAAQLMAQVPPVAIYALGGYAALAEVYLRLWEQRRDQGGHALQASIDGAQHALRALRIFALGFPLARPRALLWRGLYHWLRGESIRAHAAWRAGLAAAQRLGMPYEQGRAHYEIGRHLTGRTRRAHLGQAAAIFARLDAGYDLELVRAADG